MCQHAPACPSAEAPDHEAAVPVAVHPDHGWALRCNGVLTPTPPRGVGEAGAAHTL
ncbi:DUF5999 family protein [Streptomyces sp. bgisy060]|uniref:DUF5999 family protein n=1 Tax=Streptomyces sp. bgisy060 TaxID=3413775 RepID=UPI003EBFDD6D